MTSSTVADLSALARIIGLESDTIGALTRLIPTAPVPSEVVVALERTAAAQPEITRDVLETDVGRTSLVALLGASRSLGVWLQTHPEELAGLASTRSIQHLPPRGTLIADAVRTVEESASPENALRVWRRRWFVQIVLRDLLLLAPLTEVGATLSDIADACLHAALVIAADGDTKGLALIGMGKLGGCELNYASDVDVLFVSDDSDRARTARKVLEVMAQPSAEGIVWRTDADLRPEGRAGALVRTVPSYLAYYERWADAWEFQALIKRRPVAGDEELGRTFVEAAEPFVYPAELPPSTLDELRAMKARAEEKVASAGLADRQVKLGRGGIRDVEFAVQLLQVVHGRADRSIRSPNTLEALTELAASGYIAAHDAETLSNSYIKLRTVEHRLQLESEAQVHTLPTAPGQLERLARLLGYRADGADTAAGHFADDFRRDLSNVRSVHERLFYRPLLEAFGGPAKDGGLGPEAAEERLRVFGFSNADATRRSLEALRSGLSRRSRLMEATLPLVLGWLSDTPDPDLGLLMLDRLTSSRLRAETVATVFRESPLAAQRLCTILGTSRLIAMGLERFPELLLFLEGETALSEAKSTDELHEGAMRQLSWRDDEKERLAGLRRFVRREQTRIAMRDLLGFADSPAVAAEMTSLAEACLEAGLVTAATFAGVDGLPDITLIGMGRLGGGELAYPSDLDIMVVYRDVPENVRASTFEKIEKTVKALIRTVSAPTDEGTAWELDLDLRPEGKRGVLARSLSGYVTYWERWAETWEFQSLLRARPVAGNMELGADFLATAEPFVYQDPFPRERLVDIRTMKVRIDKERLPKTADPTMHLKLGRGGLTEIEFAVQALQLEHGAKHQGVRTPSTTDAIEALADAGLLEPAPAQRLRSGYRFVNMLRNRLALLGMRDPNSMPQNLADLSKLARSLGYSDHPAPTLREDYRRNSRQAHQAADTVLYPEDNHSDS